MNDLREFGDAAVFRGSPIQNAILVILFFLMLASGPYLLLSSHSTFHQFLGAVGIPICLWLVLRVAANLYRGRQVMVAIGRQGLFDWRISDDWIPWAAIKKINETPPVLGNWLRYGVTVQVDPQFLSTFREKKLSRILRVVNGWCGLPGSSVTLVGVDGKFTQVAAALDRYCPLWR